MPGPQTIPLLPCGDIDEIEPFFAALGFRTTYRQHRPYACLALNGHGIDLQYYGLDGHVPEASHSSCLVIVDDTGQIWEEFASGLRGAYDRLPAEVSRLGEAVQNAVVLADSKGDVAQATKVLQGALRRAPAEDPSIEDAREFLVELQDRQGDG